MKIRSVNLEKVCGVTSRLPENDKMEVAFAGKSNVGKSSLINALIGRKQYARTSQKPGKTQTINFYNVNDRLYLVDLPGYGYARASVDAKAKWGKMVDRYLERTRQLRIVFLLVDIRHEPGQNDVDMYRWCVHYGYNPIVIATKSDKLKKDQVDAHVDVIRNRLDCIEGTPIIPFSALRSTGKDEIWEYVDGMLEAYEAEPK